MSWISEHKGDLKRLVPTLMKVGCVGFGGGSALIPVLHQEAVENEHLISEDNFNKDVVVATITPGALPVEISAGIGRELAGVPGMVLGATSIALPGVLMVVMVCSLLASFGDVLTRQINFLAIGVSGYIIAVLFDYVEATMRIERQSQTWRYGLPIIILVFVLTCGKQLHRLLELSSDYITVFGISTVNMMAVALFMIFWTRGQFTKRRVIPAALIAFVYCLSLGGLSGLANGVFDIAWLRNVLRVVMVVMSVYGIGYSFGASSKTASSSNGRSGLKRTLAESGVCFGIIAIAVAIAMVVAGLQGGEYTSKGCLSSILSFGGGDAYLAIAGGMFVSGGMVAYQSFYSILVPVANASPGSILCEVLSGVGYFLGLGITGSIWGGYLVALCGFMCSIAMSCITFSLVNYLYERFEDLSILDSLKRLIRPIISGLLLTVVLGFLYNCLSMGNNASWPGWIAVAMCVVLALLNRHVGKRFAVKPLYMVFGSAVITVVLCNIMGTVF